MTTVHAQLIGDKALISREELARLVELAEHSEPIQVELADEDLPTVGMMRLAEQGASFDFWNEAGENIYGLEDGDAV